MPKQVRIRRGTTAQHATFTGAEGEVTYDTTKKCLVLHDGVTAGGKPVSGFLVLDPNNLTLNQEIKSLVQITGGNPGDPTDLEALNVPNGVSVFIAATVNGLASVKRWNLQQEGLTYASSVDLSFASFGGKRLNLAGNVVLTASGHGFGHYMIVKILCDGSTRNLTFPAGWKFVGAAAPTTIAANKIALLHLWCFGTTDSDVVARYLVQP